MIAVAILSLALGTLVGFGVGLSVAREAHRKERAAAFPIPRETETLTYSDDIGLPLRIIEDERAWRIWQ